MRRMPFLLSVLSLTALPSLERLAHADEPSPTTSSPPATTATATATATDQTASTAPPEHWYGWQPFMADAGSIAMLVAGARAQGAGGETLALLGGIGFAFGSPLIHLAHEQPGKAAGSLALRLLVPAGAFFTGAFLGVLATSGQHDDGREMFGPQYNGAVTGAFLGGLSGTILAVGLDYFVLARETVRPPPPREPQATIEPRVSSVHGGATFGIGGTF